MHNCGQVICLELFQNTTAFLHPLLFSPLHTSNYIRKKSVLTIQCIQLYFILTQITHTHTKYFLFTKIVLQSIHYFKVINEEIFHMLIKRMKIPFFHLKILSNTMNKTHFFSLNFLKHNYIYGPPSQCLLI